MYTLHISLARQGGLLIESIGITRWNTLSFYSIIPQICMHWSVLLYKSNHFVLVWHYRIANVWICHWEHFSSKPTKPHKSKHLQCRFVIQKVACQVHKRCSLCKSASTDMDGSQISEYNSLVSWSIKQKNFQKLNLAVKPTFTLLKESWSHCLTFTFHDPLHTDSTNAFS